MKLSIIAAVGKNNELGKNNNLIWNLPEDLKFFKEKTIGKTIVMGRKTFFSLPKMLPNRKHIVLSRNNNNFPEKVTVYRNIEKFLQDYEHSNEEIFIIGGSMIYKLFIDYATNIYLTEIDDICSDATVYFPDFNKSLFDKEELCDHEENDIKYKHVLYRKRV